MLRTNFLFVSTLLDPWRGTLSTCFLFRADLHAQFNNLGPLTRRTRSDCIIWLRMGYYEERQIRTAKSIPQALQKHEKKVGQYGVPNANDRF